MRFKRSGSSFDVDAKFTISDSSNPLKSSSSEYMGKLIKTFKKKS